MKLEDKMTFRIMVILLIIGCIPIGEGFVVLPIGIFIFLSWPLTTFFGLFSSWFIIRALVMLFVDHRRNKSILIGLICLIGLLVTLELEERSLDKKEAAEAEIRNEHNRIEEAKAAASAREKKEKEILFANTFDRWHQEKQWNSPEELSAFYSAVQGRQIDPIYWDKIYDDLHSWKKGGFKGNSDTWNSDLYLGRK